VADDPAGSPGEKVDPIRARQASSSPYNLIVLTVSLFLAVMAAVFLYMYFYA
jgi:hypothetical protein